MFSDVLRKLRKEKGLSQSALADILNMSQQAIGKWETNHATPDFDTLVQLADYFNVSTDANSRNSLRTIEEIALYSLGV